MPDNAQTSPLAPLRHPAFRLIWTSTLVANLGSLIQNVGAAWLMAELTPSHNMVALVQASTTLPIMVLAIAAGALADNFDRRRVMLAAQGFMAMVSAVLAVFAWADWLGPWSLLCFTFTLGCGAAIHLPSWQASMRDLVPRADLPAAVTLNSMSFNLMRSLGPAIGGLIVASAGEAVAFGLNAVSYLAVIYALWRWRPVPEERSLPAERLGSAITAGLRYVALSPGLVRIMARASLFGVSAIIVLALLPVVTRDLLGGGARTYGVLLGAFGTGAIAGAFAGNALRHRTSVETIIAGAFLVFAVGVVWLAFASSALSAVPGLLLTGAAWVSALSLFNVSTQLATPRWVVGRALSIYQTSTFGGMAVGAWFWGLFSEWLSIHVALLTAAVMLLAGAALGRIWRMPDFAEANLDPANRFHAPAVRLDMTARSGPVMIMIDWSIPPESTNRFLALMEERRRIRRRDGARRWALLRDLETPDVWVETYHVATWTEYLRHNQRRTHADTSNWDNLFALHRGEPPRVHRMIEHESVPLGDDMPLQPHPEP